MDDGRGRTAPGAKTQEMRFRDLSTAAYLLANGLSFVRTEPTGDGHRVDFVLRGDFAEAERLVNELWANRATVLLHEFLLAQRHLKAAVHRMPRGVRG